MGAEHNGHANGQPDKPFTLQSLRAAPDRKGRLRRIPRLTVGALRLVWQAGPRNLILMTVLQFLAGGAIGLQLLLARRVLSELISVQGLTLESLAPEFGALLAVTVGAGVISALAAQQARLLVELVSKTTFDNIIDVATEVELDSFETPSFYDSLQRARTSGMTRPIEMVNNLTALMTGVLTSIGIGAALLLIEPLLLGLVALAGIPLLAATIRNSGKSYVFEYAMTPQSRERLYLMQLLTEKDAAKEVRAFGAGTFLRHRYDALTEERITALRKFLRERMGVSVVGAVGTGVGIAIALVALAWMLIERKIDLASGMTAGLAMQMLSTRLTTITGSFGKLVEAGMFIDDYNGFVAMRPEASIWDEVEEGDTEPTFTPGLQRRFEGLKVENVSFTYPSTGKQVLDDVSFEVQPGQVVALVGENGSGKTTLVKLICQLYEAQRGRMLWNGLDTDEQDPREIRDDITVIFQDYIQYHLSARENIALGRVERDPDLSEVVRAAEQAGAHKFIQDLPDDYETRLGRQFYGGHELSIGQWQRLSLARAFFRGGNFLVLDEPTASLDPRAEYELFEQMKRLSAGRSVLLVSHRFSSVRSADQIYVIQHGRITEAGSHEELVAQQGHYAELYSLQAAAYLGMERA